MVKREEVEALLRELREAHQWRKHQGVWGPSAAFVQDHMERIEELARTWLAVDAAPVVEWYGYASDFEEYRNLTGQRVKLVLVPEAGGGEG